MIPPAGTMPPWIDGSSWTPGPPGSLWVRAQFVVRLHVHQAVSGRRRHRRRQLLVYGPALEQAAAQISHLTKETALKCFRDSEFPKHYFDMNNDLLLLGQGGFVNLLQQPYVHPSPQRENFHFVGLINQNFNGTSPASGSKETPTPDGSSDKQGKKRWTHDEEVRLANAWLNNSYDPINGCDKKGDSFWKDITEEFNKTAPENHTRDINQLKNHWTRLKTAIN
ncbi:hypothetical protein EJB05_44063, partial [Eragrostis curvula]